METPHYRLTPRRCMRPPIARTAQPAPSSVRIAAEASATHAGVERHHDASPAPDQTQSPPYTAARARRTTPHHPCAVPWESHSAPITRASRSAATNPTTPAATTCSPSRTVAPSLRAAPPRTATHRTQIVQPLAWLPRSTLRIPPRVLHGSNPTARHGPSHRPSPLRRRLRRCNARRPPDRSRRSFAPGARSTGLGPPSHIQPQSPAHRPIRQIPPWHT